MANVVNIFSSTLSANEAADISVAREVFGAITINPMFNTDIDLDTSDAESLKLLEQAALKFISERQSAKDAFAALGVCLQNEVQKIPECDKAAKYFYEEFNDLTVHTISSKRALSEDTEASDSAWGI